jgi:carboxylesterase
MKKLTLLILLISVISGCSKEPVITDDMLDGKVIFDPSLYKPEQFLVSYAIPNPTPVQAKTPVVIAIHGYSATTFEWDEFKTWANGRTDFLISQVLMGGHGRTYEDFKNATWQDWRTPVIEEYERLLAAGYTNISFLGSSTGCTIILKMLADDYFKDKIAPKQVLLIDPNVIYSNKTLSLVHILGPLLVYSEADNTAEEDKVWYHYRPQETLKELREITKIVRLDLQKGITLPAGTSLKAYKSENDDVADPVSAVLIHKGTKTFDGNPVDIAMVPSNLHVYTRLSLRSNVNPIDIENQKATFEDIAERLVK